jgi:hypothetical protein
MQANVANFLESDTSPQTQTETIPASEWLKLGIVAAASVLAGGVAAAWWYKSTLKKLRQADQKPINPHYGISGDDPRDDS